MQSPTEHALDIIREDAYLHNLAVRTMRQWPTEPETWAQLVWVMFRDHPDWTNPDGWGYFSIDWNTIFDIYADVVAV